jgi:hypothetical protein
MKEWAASIMQFQSPADKALMQEMLKTVASKRVMHAAELQAELGDTHDSRVQALEERLARATSKEERKSIKKRLLRMDKYHDDSMDNLAAVGKVPKISW